ncbi:MAG: glycosyltransferase family 9 protein [Ignavibacteriae bacterium]|nr:MAG: glycosyltransferase family 9 protein [Ignavibacteriota bacterium]
MNIPVMKYLDENIGKAACFALNLFSKNKITSIAYKADVKNILLVKFWGMGSIILTTPALKNIRKEYPNAKIYYLTLAGNKEICSLIDDIDEVVGINLDNPFSFTIDTLRKIYRLRKKKFDLVFDFEFFTYYSAIIVKLINKKYSVGFNNLKNNRNKLFSETIIFENNLHTRENFLNLVSSYCNIVSGDFSRIEYKNEIHTKFNLGGEPVIVVNPNASLLAYERRLPAKDYIRIIDHLTTNNKFKIALIGLEEESVYVNGIFESLINKEKVINLCGKLNIENLAGLLSSSLCLITNDSGPLHMASALNVPSISFFGPESPGKYGPLSRDKLVFYNNLDCSPCMSVSNSKTVNCIYNKPLCMTAFDMDSVINRIDSFVSALLAEKEIVIEENNSNKIG